MKHDKKYKKKWLCLNNEQHIVKFVGASKYCMVCGDLKVKNKRK